MTTTKRESMNAAILAHGKKLLRIFTEATERDPVKLCRQVRRLESRGGEFAIMLCNGPTIGTEDEQEAVKAKILDDLDKLLGWREADVPVFLNLDPRGHALKIDDEWMRASGALLHTDWGGYGIIAPDLS